MNDNHMLPTKEIKRYENEFNLFAEKHWVGDDSLLKIIITSHLYIESAINEIFDIIFRSPQALDRMSFSQKIAILEASNLIPADSLNRLKKMNTIRNNFAHDLNYSITYAEVKALNIEKVNKKDWERIPTTVFRYCMSYITGVLHAQITIIRQLKKDGKIIL